MQSFYGHRIFALCLFLSHYAPFVYFSTFLLFLLPSPHLLYLSINSVCVSVRECVCMFISLFALHVGFAWLLSSFLQMQTHTHTVLISFFCYAHEFRWIFHSVRSSSISISLSLSLALFQIKSKLNEVFCFCSNLASMSGQWAEHIFHLSIHILVHIAHTEIDTKRSHLMQMSSSTAEKWMSFINEREKMCLPYRNARVIMDILQLACSDRQYY